MKFIQLPFKLLIYDIETSYLEARVWRPGEQVVRHDQLVPGKDVTRIITLSYKWYGEKKVHTLDWGYNKQDDKPIIEAFDKVVKQADVILGKNSDRFDNKHINTQRMLHDLPAMPQWLNRTDDLEKQLRRYFAFPSYSLDYVSKILGLGGKNPMEFRDWVRIVERDPKYGRQALKKMIKYNQKDVLDTEAVLSRVLPHVKLKYNSANTLSPLDNIKQCILCGSTQLTATKIIASGTTKYQEFHCNNHNGYAGRATYKWDKNRHKKYGKMS